MTTHHVAIWMDHNEARVLRLAPEGSGFEVDHVSDPSHHTHPRKVDGRREPADKHFLAKIEERIAQADEVFICGPASAKDELVRHLEAHRPQLAKRVDDRVHGGGPVAALQHRRRGLGERQHPFGHQQQVRLPRLVPPQTRPARQRGDRGAVDHEVVHGAHRSIGAGGCPVL